MTAKLLTFASFSYLARILGPKNYGFVEFTLAVMVFFSLPADLGLGEYGAREIARDPASAPRILRAVTGLRMALALASMLALGVFILLLHKSTDLKALLALYGVSLFGGPFLLQWFFQSHDQMQWVGIASIVRQAGFAVLVFFVCRRGTPLAYVGAIECASVFAVATYCIFVAHRMGYGWPWPDLRIGNLISHLGEAVPIGLTEMAWAFMWYFCTVLLGLIFTDRTLGWFGASHRLLMALHTFVWLYFFNLLPSISRCAGMPRRHLLELMDGSLRFIAWAGFFAAALLSVLAPEILSVIYGRSFRGASASFSLLVWMLPIAMISGHHRYILIAYRFQKRLLRCTVASAVAAVVLGLILVPVYGGIGAAWALLIANFTNFLLVYRAVQQSVVEIPVAGHLAVPAAALAVSAACYLILAKWNAGAALAVAISLYVAALVASDGQRLAMFTRNLVRSALPAGSRT
jgi:O-antigen/teichoic acid export membrane protein